MSNKNFNKTRSTSAYFSRNLKCNRGFQPRLHLRFLEKYALVDLVLLKFLLDIFTYFMKLLRTHPHSCKHSWDPNNVRSKLTTCFKTGLIMTYSVETCSLLRNKGCVLTY